MFVCLFVSCLFVCLFVFIFGCVFVVFILVIAPAACAGRDYHSCHIQVFSILFSFPRTQHAAESVQTKAIKDRPAQFVLASATQTPHSSALIRAAIPALENIKV